MQQNHNVARDGYGGAGLKVEENGPTTIFNSNQHPSVASNKAVFESLPLRRKVIARAISKQRIGQTQEEFRRQNEQRILSDIIKYESELGRKPEWLDLLGRFSCLELTVVEQDLGWVYPHLFEQTDYKLAIGKMVMA